MGSFAWSTPVVFDANFEKLFNGYSQNLVDRNGSSSVSSSLVLDSERGELVKAPVRLGQKGVKEDKAIAALKNHSEAERRRRERINSHLNMLRDLVPSTDKMDKASLLAEVISHVKELKKTATEACQGFIIPVDVDEVRVEPHEDGVKGVFSIKVSFCCEDRPEILSDLRQVLKPFNLKTVKAEITTLGGRMKNVFVMSGCKEQNSDDLEGCLLTSSIHQALRSILDKFSSPPEFSPRTTFPNKRPRVSLFDSSSSSS